MPVYKVLVVEVDGADLDSQQELLLTGDNTLFDFAQRTAAFRAPNVGQALADLNEEVDGVGYTELTYTAGLVTAMTGWSSAAKTLKRYDVTFTYLTGLPLIEIVTKRVYADNGTTVVATTTKTVTYTNNVVTAISTTQTRP